MQHQNSRRIMGGFTGNRHALLILIEVAGGVPSRAMV